MTSFHRWLLVCAVSISVGLWANEPVPAPNEPTCVAALTPEERARLENIPPAIPEEKIDYCLYLLHKYVADGTLLVAVESDRIRIPLLIGDLRRRLAGLTQIAHTKPELYRPFLANIAQNYAGLASAVPDMTYFEARWWRNRLLASAALVREGRSKALLNGVEVSVLDSFAQIYEDFSRIVTPPAYVSRMGDMEEQIRWWWRSASSGERVEGLGKKIGYGACVLATLIMIIGPYVVSDKKDPKDAKKE